MTSPSDGSSAAGAPAVQHRSFDLSQATEVLLLLRDVHRSTLMPEVKNRIRDDIFLLQQNGTSLSTQVVRDLQSIGISTEADNEQNAGTAASSKGVENTPASTDVAPAVASKPSLSPAVAGFRRPAPQFVPKAPVASTPSSPPVAVSDDAASPITPEAEPVAMLATEKEEIASVSTPPVSTSEHHKSEPTPSTPQANAVASAPVASGDTVIETAQSRIATIKRSVNDLVGNPVNLIDADNAVGREYMNALLDAMKRVNSGAADAEIERSLTRLENAFETVQQIVAQKDVAPKQIEPASTAATDPVPPISTPASVPMASSFTETSNEKPTATDAPEATAMPSLSRTSTPSPLEPVMPEPTPTPQTSANPVPITVQSEPKANMNVVPPAVADTGVPPMVHKATTPPMSTMPPVPLPNSAADEASNEASSPVPSTPVQNDTAAPTPPVPEAVMPPSPSASADVPVAADVAPTGIRPVSKDKQIKDLMADQDAKFATQQAEKMAEKAKDPLYAEDVSAGLQQLLSEWKLFKSSGLFGTGPSGIEHPLFKEISHLTMAAVLAGRYESATADVKQSITDYMNGWRYEEGIVHEHGETFEHYLRRVIRHILDRTATA